MANREQTDEKQSGNFDFFWRFLSLFLGSEDQDRQKKRRLREIAKELKYSKYKFYKPKTGEALNALGRFFYDIYKTIAPAHLLVEHADQSSVLKAIVIESFLSEEQRTIQEELNEDVIRKRSETVDPKQLASEYKEKLITFYSAFDSATVKKINAMHNLMDVFLKFIHVDYFFIIKKFDGSLPENDFKYKPRFDALNGDYISDDIKDFLEVAPLLDPKADWKGLLGILEVYKGTSVIAESAWRNLLKTISDVRASAVLELMVRHIDENPDYVPKIFPPDNRIVEEYLSKMKNQTEITIQKILNERRKDKIDHLALQVFGTTAVSRMRNYTDKANLTFAKKMLGGYTYVIPANYLKAFLLDYLKSSIKKIVDVLIIRGQWSTAIISQQVSESYHQLMSLTDQLLKFDESLSDDGDRGAAIKNALHKSDRDKSMLRVLRQHLNDVNAQALKLVKESTQHLIAIAKYLRQVLDDRKNKPSEVILNWREIESVYDGDIDADVSSIYKKVYYFAQLLQYHLK
jgi:HrpA-like RNA helicase